MSESGQGGRRDFLHTAARLALAASLGTLLPRSLQAAPVFSGGGREILTFSDGALTLPAGMVSADRPRDELAQALRAGGFPADQSVMPLNVTAIRDGDAYTFIDCGAGQRFLTGSGKLGSALEGAGIDRGKVTRVLFTHAHPDHLWGAVDEFDELLFPNAKYLISRADRDFWQSPQALKAVPEDRQSFVVGAQRILKTLGDKLDVFAPGAEVAPGIAAFDTGGHTPGHVSFEVKAGGESVMVLGDALTHPLISFAHPDWKPASDQEPDRAVATRRKVLDDMASRKLRVIGYHLPNNGAGRVERAGSAYRFVTG